jgi:hypothetical protein
MMSIPNLGPELSDSSDPDSTESNRRSNPASAHLDESPSGVMEAAQTRAATVSHRFGGARYALTRPDRAGPPAPTDQADPAPEPEPDGQDRTDEPDGPKDGR